jgi:hypothetical protein
MPSSQISICFVFNGDADGIISQHLLELAGRAPTVRITGLKRDIKLLDRVTDPISEGRSLELYVCDINLGDNRDALLRRLKNPTTTVTWYDHHEPGEIPASPRLKTRIVTARGTCTALLVHADLIPKHPGLDARWAAMAAYGDNLPESAEALLKPLALHPIELREICEAGELINYNAYGETVGDVLFPPLEVAVRMAPFTDAAEFIRKSGLIPPLREQLREDMERMGGLSPVETRDGASLYTLPAEPWARRLGSTFANRVALADPARAVAVLHPLRDGSFQVSVRAPRGRPDAPPASALAAEFPSGGGRALAAGINRLGAGDVAAFARRFFEIYGG